MANGFFHLSSRKLYIICTVVIFAFMLYLYSQYNVAPVRIHGFGNDEQVVQENQTDTTIPDLGMNDFKEILMEHVNLNYSRNIYITIKTTHKFYLKRVLPLMLTWLQTVDKNKVSIITDRSFADQNIVYKIRKAGFHIIDTECVENYLDAALSCKASHEFDAYYKAIEAHPDEKDNYQWFCHFDDDIYVNILQLSQLLKQYDSRKPYYIGKWPVKRRRGELSVPLTDKKISVAHKMKYDLKMTSYQYATGAGYCISYTLMMEAKKFFEPPAFQTISAKISRFPDDMTVGFVIGGLLGYNLTDVTSMTNQYDKYVHNSTLKDLIKCSTVSGPIIKNNKYLEKIAASLETPLPVVDKAKFLLFHCLLYPTVSWCQGVREIFKTLDL